MVQSANLGFPRIGFKRELKKATERYWKGELDYLALRKVGAELRERHWRLQRDLGIEIIPSNDFSFYDQVLDTTAMLGAVPLRYQVNGGGSSSAKFSTSARTSNAYAMMADVAETAEAQGSVDLDTYFAMARGSAVAPAMEMTKWFDTNYHYIVPEFYAGQEFRLASRKAIDEFKEAKALGIHTRPVVVGPVTFLSLGKTKSPDLDPLSLLDRVLPVYAEILTALAVAGADWVQIDEPILGLDLNDAQRAAMRTAYAALSKCGLKILIASYFERLDDNLSLVAELPVDGLHVDLVRAPEQLAPVLTVWPKSRVLSLGVIDGRNIWRADLDSAFSLIEKAVAARGGDDLQIAPSCSLLHTPVDLDGEAKLDAELKSWLAFSKQKLAEIQALTRAANGKQAATDAFAASASAVKSRSSSPRVHDAKVAARIAEVKPGDANRSGSFAERQAKQRKRFALPKFPTTTIGSFPQTEEVRKARAAHRRGDLNDTAYDAFLMEETENAIRVQENLGIDVLVHGEFERNDMVEYFGEQLSGFVFTQNGWVQSYGTRYVKPPIIFGDVSRPNPMTLRWSAYAQSLTDKPVKGMLTGPVTILQWSFVRDDQPRSVSCRQIALAIRDEVVDLEQAGIGIIQIDEPALREGLPIRQADRDAYLQWAVECFRHTAAGASDLTQIHTHMCYGEFNDIMEAIAALDADVISIETSRSQMELLDGFSDFKYPNEIGPGVYDIHSPRCPCVGEMTNLIAKARERLAPEQIWINPDCGLKTRKWDEVLPALKNMVEAAKKMRESI